MVQTIETCSPNGDIKNESVEGVLADLRDKYSHQPTFLQAVEEMALSIRDLLEEPVYREIFRVMTEPERAIAFRVPWMDDSGKMQYNRGWRIEFNRYAAP